MPFHCVSLSGEKLYSFTYDDTAWAELKEQSKSLGHLLDKIIDYMALSPKHVDELIRAASELQHDVIIKPINNEQREVALMFALKLQNKNFDTEKLLEFLKN